MTLTKYSHGAPFTEKKRFARKQRFVDGRKKSQKSQDPNWKKKAFTSVLTKRY